MSLRLHWSPDSANLPIRIALEMFELPFQAVRVNRAAGEHQADQYRRLNPQGLLPVLEDNDVVLFETGAILWHLVEKTGRLGPDGPDAADPQHRAQALRWLFYLSNTLHADLRAAFYTDRYVANPADIPRLRAGLARRISDHCALLERQLSGGLLGPTLTVIDVYLGACLRWAQIYPAGGRMVSDLSRWPRLSALLAHIEDHPAAQTAFRAEAIDAKAFTAPRPPDLPASDVTG